MRRVHAELAISCLACCARNERQTVWVLTDPQLVRLLQLAYSAERAAALAYQGHARSLRGVALQRAVKQIEIDEWEHRLCVRRLLTRYQIPVSAWLELKFYVIGKIISLVCFFIGWFMPHYFAGRLESGNTCEYIVMLQRFQALGITEHDELLYAMAIKEKEHEVFFLEQIHAARQLPIFECVFRWGRRHSANDINLAGLRPVPQAALYCQE